MNLDYMHARYFSPNLGRFHSVDPVGAAPSWPQSWNRYSYVLGNPVKYTDPRGLYWSPALVPFDQIPIASFNASTTVTSTNVSLFFSVMGLLKGPSSSLGFGGFPPSAFVRPTWDPVTNNRITQLHPCIEGRSRALVNLAEDRLNLTLRISSGFRRFRGQAREFAKGRTAPGNIVTYARPGQSYHNYGLAIDVAPIIGDRLDYNINWHSVGTPGENLGFEWGGRWNTPDKPHFQLTLGRTTSQLQALTSQQLQALTCP